MVRYTVFVMIVLGSAATAVAAMSSANRADLLPATNITVIEKNQAFPVLGPLVVEDCRTEDCSVI